MNEQGDRILQRMLVLSIVVFVVATFIGQSPAVGIIWVFGLWLFTIVGGMILDAIIPRRQKP
jgi:hypothetical protein